MSHQVLAIDRGADKSWLGYVKRAGIAESIADCTFTFKAFDGGWKGTVFLEKTLDIVDGPTGLARLLIDSADTIDLDNVEQTFVFQIIMVNADSKIYPVTRGELVVSPSGIEAEEEA